MSPRRQKMAHITSSDVIIGLYFTAERQNVSTDDTTPEGLGAGELGAETGEE